MMSTMLYASGPALDDAPIKVLNLYAGIGGNRALWPKDARVTAVESDPEIAAAYKQLWPGDEVIFGDAHQYLLDHLFGWDLIWSSAPCQSHSKLNRFEAVKGRFRYPDLDHLYGEIILLTSYAPAATRWIVENVIPYYPPLISPSAQLGRHYAWSNIVLPYIPADNKVRIAAEARGISTARKNAYKIRKSVLSPMEVGDTKDFQTAYGITLPDCADGWGRMKRRQVMRNMVDPLIGLAVWNAAFRTDLATQPTLLEVA